MLHLLGLPHSFLRSLSICHFTKSQIQKTFGLLPVGRRVGDGGEVRGRRWGLRFGGHKVMVMGIQGVTWNIVSNLAITPVPSYGN